MTVETKYNELTTKYLLRRKAILHNADCGRISWHESDRQEAELEKKYLASLMVWFGRASWEDQISIAACSGNDRIIARLDDVQKSALIIMK